MTHFNQDHFNQGLPLHLPTTSQVTNHYHFMYRPISFQFHLKTHSIKVAHYCFCTREQIIYQPFRAACMDLSKKCGTSLVWLTVICCAMINFQLVSIRTSASGKHIQFSTSMSKHFHWNSMFNRYIGHQLIIKTTLELLQAKSSSTLERSLQATATSLFQLFFLDTPTSCLQLKLTTLAVRLRWVISS